MHKRLKWITIGFEKKTQLLYKIFQQEKDELLEDHLSKHII